MNERDVLDADATRLGDALDAAWDAVVRGERPPADGLGSELVAEIGRLQALDGSPPPAPFLARLRADLIDRAGPATVPNGRARETRAAVGLAAAWPARPRRAERAGGRRWRPLREVATAAVIALALLGAVTAYRLATPDTRELAPSGGAVVTPDLLVAEGDMPEAQRLVHLDPETLADRPDRTPLDLSAPNWEAVLSADGSTLATIAVEATTENPDPEETVVTIRDGATGAQRTVFELPYAVYQPSARFSRDGTRLVVEVIRGETGSTELFDPPEWHVIETATGRELAVVPSDPDGRWPTDTWIDPDARRLYRLLLPHWPDNPGPGPALIVAHDLSTGAEIGRVEVTEVQGGTWKTDRTIPYPVAGAVGPPLRILRELRPGGALSPDGRRLALVHADRDAVTLVDVERLAVERTVDLEARQGLGERLLGFLAFGPDEVAAKREADGTRISAVFAADGRHLYTWGDESETGADGELTGRSLPLRAIDLERGEVVAEVSSESLIDVEPSPDGRNLYMTAFLPDDPNRDDDASTALRRLDALTLEVRAERTFRLFPKLLLRPAVPNGSDAYVV